MKRLFQLASVTVVAAVLAACGGDVSESISTGGTAAVGAPLAGATVSLLCNNGGAPVTGTTSATGKYTASLPATGCEAPYLFKAVGPDASSTPAATITLYGFADAATNINVTPLTDMAARFATGGDPATAFAAVQAGTRQASDYWGGANARAQLATLLAQLGLSTAGITDPLHQVFEAKSGDKIDDLLEALRAKRGAVSLEALVETVAQLGGHTGDQPWKTLFAPDSSTRTIQATNCTVGFYDYVTGMSSETPVSSVVLTLTRGTSTLTALAVPNAAETDVTFAPVVVAGSGGGVDAWSYFRLHAIGGASTFVLPYLQSWSNSYSDYSGIGLGYRSEGEDMMRSASLRKGAALKGAPLKPAAAPARLAPLAISGSTGAGTQTLDVYTYSSATQSTRYMYCDEVTTPVTRGSLNNFQPQARIASLIAGTPTAVVSSAESYPDGCTFYDRLTGTSGTYTYAVSPLGDVAFDGSSLPANWLDDLGSSVQYGENSQYDASGLLVYSNAYVGVGSNYQGVYLNRNYGESPNLYHGCGGD